MPKLLLIDTDDRFNFQLRASPPTICPPGQTIVVQSAFAGPMAFIGLRIGSDPRVRTLSPDQGVVGAERDIAGRWRVDSIEIDGEPSLAAVGALEAEQLNHPDADTLVVGGDFGVGSNVTMRATNIGDTPAYFYATWELEDVQ